MSSIVGKRPSKVAEIIFEESMLFYKTVSDSRKRLRVDVDV